jgi:hypothetical protein
VRKKAATALVKQGDVMKARVAKVAGAELNVDDVVLLAIPNNDLPNKLRPYNLTCVVVAKQQLSKKRKRTGVIMSYRVATKDGVCERWQSRVMLTKIDSTPDFVGLRSTVDDFRNGRLPVKTLRGLARAAAPGRAKNGSMEPSPHVVGVAAGKKKSREEDKQVRSVAQEKLIAEGSRKDAQIGQRQGITGDGGGRSRRAGGPAPPMTCPSCSGPCNAQGFCRNC